MSDRTTKEMQSLFADPKFSRQAWKSVGTAILNNPAKKAPIQVDKDGNQTLQSEIEAYSWNKLHSDLKTLGQEDRGPTELEMILQCQAMRARFDTSAAIFIRDTVGAKPVDESKVDAAVHNPYESLSDEELELIAELRQKKALDATKEVTKLPMEATQRQD